MYKKLLFLILFSLNILSEDLNLKEKFRVDDSNVRIAKTLNEKSHINIFLPSIPYSYISKNTNSALIRSYDNKRKWEYDLAKDIKIINDLIFIITLRKDLRFQNGEVFSVDSVLKNLTFFKKYPFLYTNINNINFKVKKLSKYKFKIILKEKYEMFISDLARIYFYTDEYLEKYQPKGSETGTANIAPGPYGMGPYILEKGFAVGSKQTEKLELSVNPYYWNKKVPKIKHITVYTQLNVEDAIRDISKHEGKLDLMPIPFNKKIDILLSKYSKLQLSKSTNNFVIFFNLINGNKRLENKDVRIALNQALNQENLLNFVYKKEGSISPFTASINYDIVKKISKENSFKEKKFSQNEIKKLLDNLELKVFTQDRFMFLWKGIEFQLKKYNVKLIYTITNSEKDIYNQLLKTSSSKNTKEWDMLIWGDDDWYYGDPWTVFFIYEINSVWSTIKEDNLMKKYIKEYFKAKRGTKSYENITRKILFRAKSMAYTLRVPSPNKVMALNKEVIFKPYLGAMLPLWNIDITKDHWSIRKKIKYPKNLEQAIKVKR